MVQEDVHRLTLELKERELKVQKLENKYNVMVAKARGSGEDGETHSQAYYVIKAAQEREELQREGDTLDAKVRRKRRRRRRRDAGCARGSESESVEEEREEK